MTYGEPGVPGALGGAGCALGAEVPGLVTTGG